MSSKFSCGLDDIFSIFEQHISTTDIVASKALSKISSEIVKHRTDLGMTQKQFAEYMGVSQGMVSKWESEDYNFSVKSLADIAVKLGLDVDVSLMKPITNREKLIMGYTTYLVNNTVTNGWRNFDGDNINDEDNISQSGGEAKWSIM